MMWSDLDRRQVKHIIRLNVHCRGKWREESVSLGWIVCGDQVERVLTFRVNFERDRFSFIIFVDDREQMIISFIESCAGKQVTSYDI